jgi:transaldolase
MPEATLDAVADHGRVPVDSIHGTYGAAEQVLADLAEVGVDYDDVMRVLETHGIEKFDASRDALGRELLPMLTAQRA